MRLVGGEGGIDRRAILQAGAYIGKARISEQPRQPRLLEADIVVVVEIIDADNRIPALQQAQRKGRTNKAGTAGKQDFHSRPSTS